MEDMVEARASAFDFIRYFRRTQNAHAIASVIAQSRRDRDQLNCCPAGAYALYLVDAATREVTRG